MWPMVIVQPHWISERLLPISDSSSLHLETALLKGAWCTSNSLQTWYIYLLSRHSLAQRPANRESHYAPPFEMWYHHFTAVSFTPVMAARAHWQVWGGQCSCSSISKFFIDAFVTCDSFPVRCWLPSSSCSQLRLAYVHTPKFTLILPEMPLSVSAACVRRQLKMPSAPVWRVAFWRSVFLPDTHILYINLHHLSKKMSEFYILLEPLQLWSGHTRSIVPISF